MKGGWGLVLWCFVAVASAKPAGRQARLTPLSKAEVKTAAGTIGGLDLGTQASPSDGGQSFLLRAAGAEDLLLLPGELTVDASATPGTVQMQCGVFVLNRHGKAYYVPVVGPDYKPYSWCEQTDGMGLAADAGPRPRLIVIVLLRAAAGNHYDMPFVLAWDGAASRYGVDYPASFWLADQRGGDTVAGARRLLRSRK